MGRFRRFVDWLANASTRAELWLLDRLDGPMPLILADAIREDRRERLRKAFPGLLSEDRERR
jgi:hypothetical protein